MSSADRIANATLEVTTAAGEPIVLGTLRDVKVSHAPARPTVTVTEDDGGDTPRVLKGIMLRIHDARDGVEFEVEGRFLGTVRNPVRIRTNRENLLHYEVDLDPAPNLICSDDVTGEEFVPDILTIKYDGDRDPTVSIDAGRRAL